MKMISKDKIQPLKKMKGIDQWKVSLQMNLREISIYPVTKMRQRTRESSFSKGKLRERSLQESSDKKWIPMYSRLL